jgi:hypothetical protein
MHIPVRSVITIGTITILSPIHSTTSNLLGLSTPYTV